MTYERHKMSEESTKQDIINDNPHSYRVLMEMPHEEAVLHLMRLMRVKGTLVSNPIGLILYRLCEREAGHVEGLEALTTSLMAASKRDEEDRKQRN